MADSPLDPINVPSGRRESLLVAVMPETLPLSGSFLETSPLVREILCNDINDCSSSDEEEGHASDNEPEQELGPEDAVLSFHPQGVAFGYGYSTVPLPGVDRPVPNPREIEESFREEVNLLRDNDILPPKDSHTRHGSIVDRVYQRFNIAEQGGQHHFDGATETDPLLETRSIDGRGTPPPAKVHELWDEAVASQKLRTTWQREVKTLVRYSAPLIATFLLHYSVTIGSVLTVGRLGMLELGAVNCTYKAHLAMINPLTLVLHSGYYDSEHHMLCPRPGPFDLPRHSVLSSLWVRSPTPGWAAGPENDVGPLATHGTHRGAVVVF